MNDESSSADDLPRTVEGIALVADAREDENLIVAQLHVAFLKLHNAILDEHEELERYRRKGESDFVAAQRALRWHYQWLVRHDYLPALLDSSVLVELEDMEKQKCAAGPGNFRIPIEFNAAAFRFGHSMVRDKYKGINVLKKDVKLSALLGLTGSKGLSKPGEPSHCALPADWVVCWDRFFETPPRIAVVNRAQRIDTIIASALYHLDEEDVKHFTARSNGMPVEPRLPVRTLIRGLHMGLPSGEEIAGAIKKRRPAMTVMTEDEVVSGAHEAILVDPKYGLRGNTPLWYYILKEAEVAPRKGRQLGPVGSYIIADVIIGALAADRSSYIWSSDSVNWKPTLWGGRSTSLSRLLNSPALQSTAKERCDPAD